MELGWTFGCLTVMFKMNKISCLISLDATEMQTEIIMQYQYIPQNGFIVLMTTFGTWNYHTLRREPPLYIPLWKTGRSY